MHFKGITEEPDFSMRREALVELPIAPKSTLYFIEQFRPQIGTTLQTFDLAPFWIEILEDNHPNIMMTCGRQTFKTTNCANLIAKYATAYPGKETTYVADDEVHRSAFSEQRLRAETFLANPQLRKFLPHGRAAVGRIKLLNGSVIYLVTDEGHYHQVEGKANIALIFDETQAQDVQFRSIAMYSLTVTKGDVYWFGIGGEAGSEYHNMWKRTDQREWIYEDKFWRDKLTFDAKGNINNDLDKLRSILAGRWIAQAPENKSYRGYHLSQEIFPIIPATIDDAITKYQQQPELSIEYQEKHYPHSVYLSHTLGEFYKAERRPITPEMVEACYIRYLSLLKPEEVLKLKATYGNEIRTYMGVDFGSGPASSQTVASIIIYWRKSGRYQLAWIDPRPQEHQMDQARHLATLGNLYRIDFGVGDLGYGQNQIKLIQDGGRDSKDRKFEGLGKRRFVGCRTIGSEVKPEMQFKQTTDEHGTEVGRLQIDKTTSIQGFIDFIGRYVGHPTRSSDESLSVTQFIIPMKNDWECDFLMNDFCSITRKDLSDDPETVEEDPRQRARKEFNHPADSVMSIIYCLTAHNNYDESRYKIYGTRKRIKR